jgi:hypothetical protein
MQVCQIERLARNEAIFREVNERIGAISERLGHEDQPYEYLCECSSPDCTERISLRHDDYEHVRADPTRFVIFPGHALEELEIVVDQQSDHLLVEKIGVAADVAEELDPRAA